MNKLILLLGLVISSNSFAGVKIYTQDGCGYCQEAKAYLNKKHVQYSECNLKNSQCLREFNNLNGDGTPLILINGTRIDGYDPQAIDKALSK